MVTAARARCRANFAPYYKVQWYDARSLAWMDIQAAHPTPAEAEAAYPPGRRCRIMRVAPGARAPLAGSERDMPGEPAACRTPTFRRGEGLADCGVPAGWTIDTEHNLEPRCLVHARKLAGISGRPLIRVDRKETT